MDARILRYFLTIVEEGNITKAAEKLNMSQPPLSKQIKQLEDELGVILFIRGKKNIQLTEAGIFLRGKATEIVSSIEKTERQISEFKDGATGQINIGAVEAVAINYLPEIIEDFSKEHERINFDVWSGRTDDILDKLDKGVIDIAFIRPPFDKQKYNFFTLFNDSWCVMIPKDNELSKLDVDFVEPYMLMGEKLIIPSSNGRISEVLGWFSDNNLAANIYCYYNVLSVGIAMVEQGLGIVLALSDYNKITVDDSIVVKELRPIVRSSINVISSKSKYVSESSTHFLEFLNDMT